MNELKMFRGDGKTYKVAFTDGATPPVPLNLTGWTVWFTVKSSENDPDNKAKIQKKITTFDNPELGIVGIQLSHNDTKDLAGDYYYDVQFKTQGASSPTTAIKSTITFTKDITQDV